MDILWSPWRYDYVAGGSSGKSRACAFCDILANSAGDEELFILRRAEFNFVILNLYPYAPGHLMVVPYEHLPALDQAPKSVTDEMMDLTKAAQAAITEVYRPDGINLGMNLGKAAGAGVEGHFHMHMLPRWVGDANFMTAVGQTRTISEDLPTTYAKLNGKI